MQGSGPGWNMQMVDLANLTTGQSNQYCLKALGGPLTVTLVWHDYPAAVSAKTALVNDLDLTVRAAGLNGFPLLVCSAPWDDLAHGMPQHLAEHPFHAQNTCFSSQG